MKDRARELLESLFDALNCDTDGDYFVCGENRPLILEIGAFLFETEVKEGETSDV